MLGRVPLILFALGLVACVELPPLPETSAGGSGGAGGMAGAGGDGFVCDDGTSGSTDNTVCTTCTNCAALGPCSTETSRCDASTRCTVFAECLNACGEMGGDVSTCIDGCVDTNPEGASVYEIAQSCLFCECPTNCDTFDNCRDVLACDDGRVPSVDEPEICDACTLCAIEGPCTTSDAACSASPDCADFQTCEIDCTNGGGDLESCFTTCSATYPTGANLYRDLATCLCAQCPDNCIGAAACDFY